MTQKGCFEEFEELAHFFGARLKLLPFHEVTVGAKKRNTPTAARQQLNSNGQQTVIAQGKGKDGKRDVLKKRLREKIDGIREKTGASKIKKKSAHERRMKKQRKKETKKRRQLARQIQAEKNAGDGHKKGETGDEDAKASFEFTDLKENNDKPKSTGRKRKMAEKFRKLNVAEKQKKTTDTFLETGEGGEKVLTTEWDHALRRASGEKVLDDPKRLQKSIDDAYKLKAKRAKKWQERTDQEQEQRQQRQEKRNHNLQLRSERRHKNKELRKAKKKT